jgi:hypothetical protein
MFANTIGQTFDRTYAEHLARGDDYMDQFSSPRTIGESLLHINQHTEFNVDNGIPAWWMRKRHQ